MPAIPATDNIGMFAGVGEFSPIPITLWGDGRIDIDEGATADKLREQAKVIRKRSALMYEQRDAWSEIIRAALLDQTADLLDLRVNDAERRALELEAELIPLRNEAQQLRYANEKLRLYYKTWCEQNGVAQDNEFGRVQS